MRTRLFVRLHRDAHVPGERCEWILRDARGGELRRGKDTLAALPHADETTGVIAHDLIVTRAVALPPGRRARTPLALANAMEPYLLSEPASNHVVALGEARDGATVLAAIGRTWLDACLDAAAHAGHTLDHLSTETALPRHDPGTWTAVCLPEGGFLRLDDEQTIALDVASEAGVPAGLAWQAQQARTSNRPPKRLRVFHGAALDREAWRAALGEIAIEDAGQWDWAHATGVEAGLARSKVRDLLPELQRVRSPDESGMRRWRLPIALCAALFAIHTLASVVHWSTRAIERARLQEEIRALFRRAVPPSEPLVDAVVQVRRALGSTQRGSGQYAFDDFVTLLARFSAETAGLPANSLRAIQYSSGALSAELRDVPAARMERLAQQLRSHGLRVEVSTSGAQVRLTLRAQP